MNVCVYECMYVHIWYHIWYHINNYTNTPTPTPLHPTPLHPYTQVKRTATNFFKKLPTDETAKERQESARKEFVQKMTTMQEETRLKLKSYLFKRQPIEEGGLFVKYFAGLCTVCFLWTVHRINKEANIASITQLP